MNSESVALTSHRSAQPPWLANFLGQSPGWYKNLILGFLLLNPTVLFLAGKQGPLIVGWMLIAEFIFTLAMALKCYPLQPGGLLAIEAVALGLTDAETVYQEAHHNFPVIMLLIFMVAGIYFMKDLLLYSFTQLILGLRSKLGISASFVVVSAGLSAFLDALTVTAVLISVALGFYTIYHKVVSLGSEDSEKAAQLHDDLEQFRAYLRSLLMHGAVGTALGGVMTMVGEPQNLLIAHQAGWGFGQFFWQMAPVTIPVMGCGLLVTLLVESTGIFGYGARIPKSVLKILEDHDKTQRKSITQRARWRLIVQAGVGVLLILGLGFHVAPVGLLGLSVIVLLTAFNGITEEHQLGKAFQEALPFSALLVVFFTIVGVIHTQHLFSPVIHWVLAQDTSVQPGLLFIANGFLSAISDNVFVATVYINEVKSALDAGLITEEHFNRLTIAINTGTNLPSVATPNGQAAFLFLLTSAIAPLIRLSYGRMVLMALPYTIVMTIMGLVGVVYFV